MRKVAGQLLKIYLKYNASTNNIFLRYRNRVLPSGRIIDCARQTISFNKFYHV